MADNAAKPASEVKRPKQGRSPAYPGIALKGALEKAKALYNAEGKYAAPVPSAFKAWGFSEKSSGGRELRAALRYFGLITVDGDGDSGKVKLTDDALRVLLDEREDQTEKHAIIRRLALNPAIHKKLMEKFPEGIKSDGTVEHYLVFDEGYNKAAAGEIVTEFKETAIYAGLFQPATIIVNSEDKDPANAQKRADTSGGMAPTPPIDDKGKIQIMDGERIVFTEESDPQIYLKVVARGDVDDILLDALEDYVKRQRKRLQAQRSKDPLLA